jgi:hypothetical protein
VFYFVKSEPQPTPKGRTMHEETWLDPAHPDRPLLMWSIGHTAWIAYYAAAGVYQHLSDAQHTKARECGFALVIAKRDK